MADELRRVRTQAERDADGQAWRAANPSLGISVSDEAIARVLAENPGIFQPCDPNRPPPHWRDIGDVPPAPRRRWWHRLTRREL